MASLTQTAHTSRRLIKFSWMGLVFILLLRAGVKAGVAWWKAQHPEPPPPPTVLYGRLPRPVFPVKNKFSGSFYLETADGKLPQMGDRNRVYFSPQASTAFLALERAKEKAARLGFSAEPVKIREDEYLFENKVNNKKMRMNVLTGTFFLSYPYLQDQTLLSPTSLPSNEEAVDEALAFLGKVGLNSEELREGEKKISYWKIQASGLQRAVAASEADLMRVDLFRGEIMEEGEGKKVMGIDPQRAGVSLLFSGEKNDHRRIVEARYSLAPIDREKFSTYPIKTAQMAWEELKGGNYYLASAPNREGQIAIRRVYLAYYEGEQASNFITPIFVFEGDGEAVAYVPAIVDEWLAD